jgi:hypothetical protein
MRPRPSQVCEDIGAGATRVFEGVCEDRQVVERLLVVHGLGEGEDRGSSPRRVGGYRTERISEDVTKNPSPFEQSKTPCGFDQVPWLSTSHAIGRLSGDPAALQAHILVTKPLDYQRTASATLLGLS